MVIFLSARARDVFVFVSLVSIIRQLFYYYCWVNVRRIVLDSSVSTSRKAVVVFVVAVVVVVVDD